MTNSQVHLNQYQLNNQIFSHSKLNLINELQILRKQTLCPNILGTGQCLSYNNAILLLSYFRMIYEKQQVEKMRVGRGNKKECRSFMGPAKWP